MTAAGVRGERSFAKQPASFGTIGASTKNRKGERENVMPRSRRGRGEGSIYQRGDGIWTTSISLGYDGNGKRLRRVLYGDSKAEVQQKLRRHDLGTLTGSA